MNRFATVTCVSTKTPFHSVVLVSSKSLLGSKPRSLASNVAKGNTYHNLPQDSAGNLYCAEPRVRR